MICPFPWERELGPHRTIINVAWAEAYIHYIKWHLDPSSLLATIYIGQISWLLCPFFGRGGRELGPHLTQCVAWIEAYLCAKWHLNPSSRLAITDMGRKLRVVHVLVRYKQVCV